MGELKGSILCMILVIGAFALLSGRVSKLFDDAWNRFDSSSESSSSSTESSSSSTSSFSRPSKPSISFGEPLLLNSLD
ncbi:MAG: hypothetical protein LBM99_04395 [Bacillales bacterium]|nr:hypothetical protein [Bacillales bacterium]